MSSRFKKRPRSRNIEYADEDGWFSVSRGAPNDNNSNNEIGNHHNCNNFTVRMMPPSLMSGRIHNKATEIVLRGCGRLSYVQTTPSRSDNEDDVATNSSLEVLGYRMEPEEILLYEVLPWESGIPVTLFNPNTTLRIQLAEEEEQQQQEEDELAPDTTTVEKDLNNSKKRMNNSTVPFICSPSDPYARPTIIPKSWIDAVDTIISRQSALSSEPRRRLWVAFAGGKNVGKSTCLKYCAHRLLSSSSSQKRKVAILDVDPGQPILGLPGTLQLSVIQTPLLATSTASSSTRQQQQQQVVRSLFFGSVSSSTDPGLYLSQVHELLQIAESLVLHADDDNEDDNHNYNCNNGNSIPILINLDGWIHGLGRQILSTVLGYITTNITCQDNPPPLKDAHIVVISGDSASKQLDLSHDITDPNTSVHPCWAFNSIHNHNDETNDTTVQPPSPPSQPQTQLQQCMAESMQVENNNGRGSDGDNGTGNDDADHMDDADDDDEDDDDDNDVVVESSQQQQHPQPPPSRQHRGMATHSTPAATIRGVRLVSYFVPHLFTNTRLLNKSQGIDDPSCEIALSLAAERPYAVSIDAIPIRYPPTISNLPEEMRMDALNESIVGLLTDNGDCRGLGLVRAIDRIHRILYLLTPIPDISIVCTLTVATFHLPVEASFLGVQSETFRYQAFDDKLDTILGANPMKSRNNIARRSGMQNTR
jgi:polynucleotide 5'-kinase involved in rRNA processing